MGLPDDKDSGGQKDIPNHAADQRIVIDYEHA
jgi:hypothetical protein